MTSEKNYGIFLKYFSEKCQIKELGKYYHMIIMPDNILYYMRLVGSNIIFQVFQGEKSLCLYMFDSFEVHHYFIEMFVKDRYIGMIDLP